MTPRPGARPMMHKTNWRNKVWLNVLTLEDRVTPALLNGIDLGALADVLAVPETERTGSAIKRASNSESVQIVSAPKAADSQVTAPSAPGRNSTTQATVQP